MPVSRIYRIGILVPGLSLGTLLITGYLNALPVFTEVKAEKKVYLCVSGFPLKTMFGRYLLDSSRPEFELSYLHSVTLSQVEDRYSVIQDKIVQTRESVADHGAGLPSMTNEPDMIRWRHEGNRFVLELHRDIERLIVRVNPDYQNRLSVNGKAVDLTAWGRRAVEIHPC